MKILIGYDGSPCAEAALHDLRQAGLPAQAEAVVAAVAHCDVDWPVSEQGWSEIPVSAAISYRQLLDEAQREAEGWAGGGAAMLRADFPQWKVQEAVLSGSPYSALIEKAQECRADLLVVGTHGRSGVGRFFLGSVSQYVLSHAKCSVRIGRASRPFGEPARILVGLDGSLDAGRAVECIAKRDWPPGTHVRIACAMDTRYMELISAQMGLAGGWQEKQGGRPIWHYRALEGAAAQLRQAGLASSTAILKGNPKSALVDEAQQWGADCIFLGARGHSRLERFLLGSVSAAVAARAHCSVEIVR